MTVAKEVVVVSCKVSDLRDALARGMLVNQRTPLPVYSCSALVVVGGKATLATQDTEKLVKVSFDATGPDMSCLIPRRMALKFLSGGDGQVTVGLSADGKKVTLSREGLGEVTLTATGLFSDFKIPEIPNDLKWAKLDAKHFLRMLRYALPCTATDESRPVLTAVLCEDGRMAAADGFRLAVITSDKLSFGLGTRLVSQSADKGGGMAEVKNQSLLPREIVMAAIRAFAKEESIEFAVGKVSGNLNDMIFLRGGNTSIMGNVGIGNYPAIDQLVPQSFDSRVSFSVPLMLQRLGMMDLRDGSGILRLHFHKTDKGEDVGDLSGRAEGEYEYAMQMPVKLENGVESKIAFNWKYVMELIKPFSVCTLDLTSLSSPGKFTGDIKELSYTVMPMFVQW